MIWAEGADAASASLHIASDPMLNGKVVFISYKINADCRTGRCVAIVPRDHDPRGYMDMGKDDFLGDDPACEWQRIMIAASHRA